MKYNITTVTDYLEELTGFNTHTVADGDWGFIQHAG